jgi:formamidopyrimidine-DNA glycosylase
MTSISSVGPGKISASDPKAGAAAPRMTFSSGRGGFLVQHFGMTGGLKYFMDMEKDNPHDRLLVSFSNGYHLIQARARPDVRTDDLDADQLRRIYGSLRHVLRTAVERRAEPERMPGSWLTPQRGCNGACPKCGGDLRHAQVSGRTAYYCPKDQE